MGSVPASAADHRVQYWSAAKPWPASCDCVSRADDVVPVSGMSHRLEGQHRAKERTPPEVSASGVQKVVRYERQDPVIAFGWSEDSPAVPGGPMLRAGWGTPQAGQTQFVHVAMKGRFGYPPRQGQAAESSVARAAPVTGKSETAGERCDPARADGICRWFGDVPQRTDVRGAITEDQVIRSNRAADPVSSINDREGRRRS